jgi:hypothetical protein
MARAHHIQCTLLLHSMYPATHKTFESPEGLTFSFWSPSVYMFSCWLSTLARPWPISSRFHHKSTHSSVLRLKSTCCSVFLLLTKVGSIVHSFIHRMMFLVVVSDNTLQGSAHAGRPRPCTCRRRPTLKKKERKKMLFIVFLNDPWCI